MIFAYTIKAWRLATQGHPGQPLSPAVSEQWTQLAASSRAQTPRDPWARFAAERPKPQLCQATAERLRREPSSLRPPPVRRLSLDRAHTGRLDTTGIRPVLRRPARTRAPEVARPGRDRVSPDVASSTNLGGWINRVGIWNPGERIDWFADDTDTLMRWRETEHGQHIELGIAEGNLVGLLGELGATWSRDGQALLPIGTLYDPFVNRALEPWSFGMYAGGQSILVGTPSGVTLAPEGGAHQSIITPSVGLEQPRCIAWEPAFGQDLEWTLLYALSRLGRADGTSAYFRLTTRPLDQAVAVIPDDPAAREERRRQVLAGGYRLRTAPRRPDVTLVGVGAIMPEVIAAADALSAAEVACDVVCLTSADLVFRALQARQGLQAGDGRHPGRAVPGRSCGPDSRRSGWSSTHADVPLGHSVCADFVSRRQRLWPVWRCRGSLPALRHRHRNDH